MKQVQKSDADLRSLLIHDHERLEGVFSALMTAFQQNAREEVARLWSIFERGLLAHFELEERDILPEFAKVDPTEVATLGAEHKEIRAKLMDLGVGLDLHLTHADVVAELVDTLRKHAKREDALLYRWAQANLPPNVQSTIRKNVSFLSRL